MIWRLLSIAICLLPLQALGADYGLGRTVATVQDLSAISIKVQDTVTVKGLVVWDNLTTKDADGKDVKTSVIKGTIQHHRVVGAGHWRTIMDVDGKRYEGRSAHESGGYVFAVDKVPAAEVTK
jgi:hypothetical protein